MLELRRRPHPNWHVIYIDVEGAADAADLFADILAQLASHPTYRRGIENIPGWQAAKNILSAANVSAKARVGELKVEFASAMHADWHRRADQIRARLAMPEAEERLLVIIDELPLLVARLVDNGPRRRAALAVLSRLSRLASPTELVSVEELQQLSAERGDAFRSALRTLEADGYVRREGDCVSFRSNLLRRWWRKHHAGDAP